MGTPEGPRDREGPGGQCSPEHCSVPGPELGLEFQGEQDTLSALPGAGTNTKHRTLPVR